MLDFTLDYYYLEVVLPSLFACNTEISSMTCFTKEAVGWLKEQGNQARTPGFVSYFGHTKAL
jgi:hypothetical protein